MNRLLLPLLGPFRSRALLAYSRLLPRWAHPFISLLQPHSRLAGAFIRLALLDTLISLSAAAFVRLLLGVLAPAESIPAILLAGFAFTSLNVVNSIAWKSDGQRLQLLIYSRIYRHVRMEILPSLFHTRRLAYLGTTTADSSVDSPSQSASITAFHLLPLLGDIPAIVFLVCMYVLLAGWSYAPLLIVYGLYILADLFLS